MIINAKLLLLQTVTKCDLEWPDGERIKISEPVVKVRWATTIEKRIDILKRKVSIVKLRPMPEITHTI